MEIQHPDTINDPEFQARLLDALTQALAKLETSDWAIKRVIGGKTDPSIILKDKSIDYSHMEKVDIVIEALRNGNISRTARKYLIIDEIPDLKVFT